MKAPPNRVSFRQARLLALVFLASTAPPLSAQTLTVNVAGDALRVQARGFGFIEGALLARGIAPGLQREFAFQRWPSFDKRIWKSLIDDARAAARPSSVVIQGSDRDEGAIAASLSNAERAGVLDIVRFEVKSLSSAHPSAPGGLVATNPPYGKRVSEGKDVRNLYAQLGKWMRNLPDWRLTMLVAEERLANQLDLPLAQLLRTSNGGIPVKLFGSARFLQSDLRG